MVKPFLELNQEGVYPALWDELEEEERTSRKPFWLFEFEEEKEAVQNLMLRRFPRLVPLLVECLESVDPQRTIYPDNPGEYDEVVMELVVLLATVDGDLGYLSVDQVTEKTREALAGRFSDLSQEKDIRETAELMVSKWRSSS